MRPKFDRGGNHVIEVIDHDRCSEVSDHMPECVKRLRSIGSGAEIVTTKEQVDGSVIDWRENKKAGNWQL
jgi:hypothetical protein